MATPLSIRSRVRLIPMIAMKFQDSAVELPELLVVVVELDEA